MAGALIVTAELAPADFAWFDSLRRRHFPPERNVLGAHLTMFHALPPSAENEVRRDLARLAVRSRPQATVAGLMSLGGGVAYRIVSDDLEEVRQELADRFRGLLTAQDAGGWRPHITIQNKVSGSVAAQLKAELEATFEPHPLHLNGLALHRYLNGPWEQIASFAFRGS